MAIKTPNVDQQRAKYKTWQDHAGRFGTTPTEFNTKVRSLLSKEKPTPAEWVHGAIVIGSHISGGRCCPKAEVIPCVCEVSYKCPDHGVRCKGSHD